MGELKNLGHIRNYRENNIIINLNERGPNFTLEVPHKKMWLNTIAFLRRRGFKIKEIPYYKNGYGKSISMTNKHGNKGDVWCTLELNPSSIEIEFGNVKNLWSEEHNFWSWKNDSRYTELTYLEEKALKLEIIKLIKYLSRYDLTLLKPEWEMTEVEKIIDSSKRNRHIHGVVNSLNDIKLYMDERGSSRNTLDKDDKHITCGEIKYFYDNRLLQRGEVWHNINNMWWVFVGGKRRNVASSNLFDYVDGTPMKKELSHDEQINKFAKLLKIAEENHDYDRCKTLYNLMQTERTYYNIWSISEGCWWKEDNRGYTNDKTKAGIYSKETVEKNRDYYDNKEITKAVLIK